MNQGGVWSGEHGDRGWAVHHLFALSKKMVKQVSYLWWGKRLALRKRPSHMETLVLNLKCWSRKKLPAFRQLTFFLLQPTEWGYVRTLKLHSSNGGLGRAEEMVRR